MQKVLFGKADLRVYILRRESQCEECHCELPEGAFICLTGGTAICRECAGLSHLEYLPAGDTAVTGRATKYSDVHVVVMKKSFPWNRSQRQGILAEPEAIQRAKAESAADAPKRAQRRAKAAKRREKQDRAYVAAFAKALQKHFPHCPAEEAWEIAAHACQKHSRRVGRSAAAKQFDPDAIRLAVTAHIRHQHTAYDQLLALDGDRELARSAVWATVDKVLRDWKNGKST